MKRILQHPPESPTGRTYWRSLGEYARTPDFEDWLHREFPKGAAEWENDPLSRRSFLRLMGASLALAGLSLSGCRRPEAHLVPFTQSPEWVVSGKKMSFATAQPRRRGSLPLLATTFDGRPVKMEGNPLHPVSQGATDNHAQASVLDLYDPARRRFLTRGNQKATPEEWSAEIKRIRDESSKSAGSSLAILAEETLSPSRERLRAELLRQFPQATWAVYDPLNSGRDLAASALAFGPGTDFRPQLSAASTILSIDCDFLGSDEGDLPDTRGFASGRRTRNPGDKMNRLYVAEPKFSLTGTMADHRLRLRASATGALLLELARQIRSLQPSAELNTLLQQAPDLALPKDVDSAWIRECAADLVAHGKTSLILVGRRQSVTIQALALALNASLGAIGTTLLVAPQLSSSATSLTALADKIRRGTIRTLVLLGGDPVYNAPADFDWASLQASIPTTIHLSSFLMPPQPVRHGSSLALIILNRGEIP